jgi:hypothetical protein
MASSQSDKTEQLPARHGLPHMTRTAGCCRMTLWTHSCLAAARAIYPKAGFVKIAEERHAEWGVEVVGETWEMGL